ncbi:MAG: hypothetical protein V1773_14485 [bacterium]
MKNSLNIEINKYLLKYKAPDWFISNPPKEKFSCIIVIPAICELKNITNLIESLNKNNRKYFNDTLIIFVINNLQSSNEKIKSENYATINYLNKLDKSQNEQLNIAVIDASSSGKELPEKDGGVGFARKIGMDISLDYFDFAKQNNLMVCLDADCLVETNYLETLHNYKNKSVGAGTIPFRHMFSDIEEEKYAIVCYEIFLSYYVAGLIYANSPFGFFSIGSTMVCNPELYIKIQGMNKRKAAEDFYFMEKLAKLVKIKILKGTYVYPQGRTSWRVPFGTGQRITRYLTHEQNEYLLYDPQIFNVLKEWNNVFLTNQIQTSNFYLEKANQINAQLNKFLINNSFSEAWDKILSNNKSADQINKQKYFWFDSFRTLKLVHYLRDFAFPNKAMFVALEEFFFISNISGLFNLPPLMPNISDQLKYLEKLNHFIENSGHIIN